MHHQQNQLPQTVQFITVAVELGHIVRTLKWQAPPVRKLREQLQDGAETSPPSDFFTPTTNREQIQDGDETSAPSDFFTPTTNSEQLQETSLSDFFTPKTKNSLRMGLKHHHQISSLPHIKRAQLMQLTLSNWCPACGDWFCSSPSGGTPTANELPAQIQTRAVTSLNTQTQDNVFFWEFKLRDSGLEDGHKNFSHDNWTRPSNGVPEHKVSSFKSTLVWKTCVRRRYLNA